MEIKEEGGSTWHKWKRIGINRRVKSVMLSKKKKENHLQHWLLGESFLSAFVGDTKTNKSEHNSYRFLRRERSDFELPQYY